MDYTIVDVLGFDGAHVLDCPVRFESKGPNETVPPQGAASDDIQPPNQAPTLKFHEADSEAPVWLHDPYQGSLVRTTTPHRAIRAETVLNLVFDVHIYDMLVYAHADFCFFGRVIVNRKGAM